MSANERVLMVVEDDPGLQSQLKWCFEDYQVHVAGDRETALTQLRRLEPPVVTLDLGLPPDPANASEGLATLQQAVLCVTTGWSCACSSGWWGRVGFAATGLPVPKEALLSDCMSAWDPTQP